MSGCKTRGTECISLRMSATQVVSVGNVKPWLCEVATSRSLYDFKSSRKAKWRMCFVGNLDYSRLGAL